MNYKYLLFFLSLNSCKPIALADVDNNSILKNTKTIKWFLNQESEISTTYKKFGLIKEENILNYKGKIIQTENNNYSYHYELFDNNYLLISIFDKPNIWSSPILIPKDSLYIYDLQKEKKSYVSLKKIRFTLGRKMLLNQYNEKINLKKEYTYEYAIDEIDLDKNELFLVNPNFKTIKFKLIPVNF